jgi:hypothetical protein
MTYLGNHTAQKRNYSSYTENEENLADAEFGYYLAGLIEGDGSIAVREGVREKIAPAFVFTFHKRELPLFEKLKQEFGSGSINQDKNGVCRVNQDKNGCRFIVTNIYTNVFSLFPKRICIYLIKVVLFFTIYALWSSFLGGCCTWAGRVIRDFLFFIFNVSRAFYFWALPRFCNSSCFGLLQFWSTEGAGKFGKIISQKSGVYFWENHSASQQKRYVGSSVARGPFRLKPYHTSATPTLHPWFITGFADAEASFRLNIYKNKNVKIGWGVIPAFSIELHGKDKLLLESIKSYFSSGFAGNKVGTICINKRDGQLVYSVNSIKELAIIVEHFDKYPLTTQKRADFQLFKWAVEMINRKEHLTMEGLQLIVGIRASLNKGLLTY